jgi:hypothetical protein
LRKFKTLILLKLWAKEDSLLYIWVSLKYYDHFYYLVRKRTTGMLYAMKMVKKTSVHMDDLRYQQVLSERNILAEMSHQFVV